MISKEQIAQFNKQGFVVVDGVISDGMLKALNIDLQTWVQESRGHDIAWGVTIDGRPRFDVDIQDHSADHPSLRRVSSPTEISESYLKVAMHSDMAEIAGVLIGAQGARFHHSKINAKLPHTKTSVKWHQDFPFTPHTNDDLVTALLMVGDVTEDNGPLQVIPGSHRGPLYSHWHNGVFTGAVAQEIINDHCSDYVSCTGRQGAVCFMHTRLLHSSGANATDYSRNLFIAVYAAEDALALSESPLPSAHAGSLVYGTESEMVRVTPNHIRLPEKPKGASFFLQQAGADIS
ncbi:MAG TPA: restriction endonuclease subunit S [Advenella kashmirensis]|uniref:Restriction endonuclease subunit S n=1 Tax=Advenella kashmirensis TaxID=310575 RepID=A0A356LJS2_9BURK|nr:restriction endonuclease subunit S [Advenella kashmirensis]